METLISKIKTPEDAYTLAEQMVRLGDRNPMYAYISVRVDADGYICAKGQSHNCDKGEQRYAPCEFADFVLWPERKRINDALRDPRARDIVIPLSFLEAA